jgi:hypothetical protein
LAQARSTVWQEEKTMTDWTTRVLPELTRPYGVEEIHSVWFAPAGWIGKGTTLFLGLPECELHASVLDLNGEVVTFVNRPPTNKNIKKWIRSACKLATEQKAPVFFGCDTVAQAAHAAKMAERLLPNHQRMALERIYDPSARANLN